MIDPYSNDYEDSNSTVFRDVIMLALFGFVVIVFLLLPYVNPIAKKSDQETKAPGNLIVEMIWPDESSDDIDLWVKAPGDDPVGYSNMAGRYFNLLRDDLGTMNDITGLNYENAYTRGIPSGEYVVNVNLYQSKTSIYPVHVRVIVSVKAGAGSMVQILTRTVKLNYTGHEITVFRFTMNEEGNLEPDTIHDRFISLKSEADH